MKDEITEINRKRAKIMRSIEEKQRLMDLIQNKAIYTGYNNIDAFNMIKHVNVIKKAFRNYLNKKYKKDRLSKEKALAKGKFNYEAKNNPIYHEWCIKRIQREYRKHWNRRRYIENNDWKEYRKNFFQPIKYDRAAALRKEMVKRLKASAKERVDGKDFGIWINKYFNESIQFCEGWPEHIHIRDENFWNYYKLGELINYVEQTKSNPNSIYPPNEYISDRTKEDAIKAEADKLEKELLYNQWWYDQANIDDFEENNLINEIDNLYNFESRSSILNKK